MFGVFFGFFQLVFIVDKRGVLKETEMNNHKKEKTQGILPVLRAFNQVVLICENITDLVLASAGRQEENWINVIALLKVPTTMYFICKQFILLTRTN